MNTRKTADAVVRRLEAAIPVYDVSERGYSLYVDAPLEGDVGIAPGVRAFEGGRRLPEDLEAELRVRDDVGGWAR